MYSATQMASPAELLKYRETKTDPTISEWIALVFFNWAQLNPDILLPLIPFIESC